MTNENGSLVKCIACAVGVLVLVSCGSNSGTPASPTPTPTRTVVKSGTFRVSSQRATGNSFSITSAGTVTIINSWGSASNQMQVRVATEASCGAPEFTRGICPWLHNDPSTTSVPQKTTTVALSAAGNYIYWATNTGSTDETVTYEVYLTAP